MSKTPSDTKNMKTSSTFQQTHSSNRLSRALCASITLLFSIALLPSSATAGNLTWSGANNALWSSNSSWAGGVAPVNGDDLIFNTANLNAAKNDYANNSLTLNSITFNATTQTLSQNSTNGINIGAGGVTAAASTGTSAMVLPVTLAASQIWSVGTGSTLSVNRGFAMGNYTLTKTGAGTLKLTTQGAGTSSAGSQILVQNGTLETLYQNDLKSTTAIIMGGSSNATVLKITDPGAGTRLADLQSPISIAAGTTGTVTINNTVLSANTTITLSGAINLGAATDADLTFNTTTGSVTKLTNVISGSMTSVNSRGNINLSGGNGEVQFNNAGNSFTGIRTFGISQGALVLGTNDPATLGSNGALGNNTATVFVGTSATPVGGLPSLLIDGAFSTGRTITVGNAANANAATYTLGGRTADASGFTGNITLNRDVQLTAATGGTVTFGGLLNDGANTQSVTKVGNGTVILSKVTGNTYDGGTTVSAGTLLVNNTSNSSTGTGAVSVSSGAILGGNGTISGVTTLVGGTIGSSGGNLSLSSTLSSSGSSSVATGSTVNVAGGSTVTAGTLLVNGNLGGALNVTGGTVGGNGTTGALTVGASGTLAPGNSPGILNTGNLSLSGALSMEINGTTVGTQYDQVNVTGTVSLVGGNTLALTLGYTPTNGTNFFLINNDGSDAITGTLNGYAQNATFTLASQQWKISYTGNSTTNAFSGSGNDLVLQAVPEPATWALLTFSMTTVMVLRRRRNV